MISVCIITLGRPTLARTLKSILSQTVSSPYEIIIVLQGKFDAEVSSLIESSKIPIHVYNYEHGLGFGYYRNQCINHSHGDILAWIDDDEWTIDDRWIESITSPIQEGKYKVVTSGCYIPLGQGYMTDCISLLGYPGGGALGFEKLWRVNDQSITSHLCSGNFAINKAILRQIQFNNGAKFGGEDNALARELLNLNIDIFYEKKATVFHVSRNLSQVVSWWKLRGKSLKQGLKSGAYEESRIKKIGRAFKNYFVFDRYIFGKILVSGIVFMSVLFSGK